MSEYFDLPMHPAVMFGGSLCSLPKLIWHYRTQSHREPRRASFWRGMARNVIRAYREQCMASSMAEAA